MANLIMMQVLFKINLYFILKEEMNEENIELIDFYKVNKMLIYKREEILLF